MFMTELLDCLVERKELHNISGISSEVFECETYCFITTHLNAELIIHQRCYTNGGSAYVDMLRDIKADIVDESGMWAPEALYVSEIFGVPGCCVFVWPSSQFKILLIADREADLDFLFAKLSEEPVV